MLNYDQLRTAGNTIRQRDSKRPIAVVHEGLFMYLDNGEQAQARDNIKRFLQEYSPDGAWITTDFSSRMAQNTNHIMKFLLRRVEKRTGRKFNTFASDIDVYAFAVRGGLRAEFLPNKHIARQLSCADIMDLNIEDVVKLAENYRAAVITLG